MEAGLKWISKLAFLGQSSGYKVVLDAKAEVGGQGLGMTPKEMLLNGMCGCTGMDVASLLTVKYKLPLKNFEVSVQATVDKNKKPNVFSRADLIFDLVGDMPADKVISAVDLSMTKYCGVTAMLVKAFPVYYKVRLNGEEIHSGQAHFE